MNIGIIECLVHNMSFFLDFKEGLFLLLVFKTRDIIPDTFGHIVLQSIGTGRGSKYDRFFGGKPSGQFFIRLFRDNEGWCLNQWGLLYFFWRGLGDRFYNNSWSSRCRNNLSRFSCFCRDYRRCCWNFDSGSGLLFLFCGNRWSNNCLLFDFFIGFAALLLHAFLIQ